MIIITIEKDVNALEVLKETCRRIAPDAIVMGFGTSAEALEFAHTSVFDMAFFDVDGEEEPFAAAQNLMECAPSAGVVLISSDEGKALEAFNIHVSGFILKPFSEENIRKEYEHYMESLNMSGDHEKKLRVRTFGNFEVFADGMPMKFRYQKTKEMLAYLIDRRGAMCSNGELISALWGDDASNRVSYLKNLKTDLMTALEDAGFHDVVVKQRGLIGIITEKVECDFYDLINNRRTVFGTYWGEYMNQYGWSEVTHAYLETVYNVQKSKQESQAG